MTKNKYSLGNKAASELLITELYIELRRKTRRWAEVTRQTAQARMGYVGQHLVSVVIGSPGGRSGGRGFDIVHKDGTSGEVKTCYRVDQLGACRDCEAGVSPDETVCPGCGSSKIERKDDSKWLISLRNDVEFAELLVPKLYYLVLFEFTDLEKPDTICASIWSVNPNSPGFVLCMVDYYMNIRSKSKSKAPFNLWPYSLKFELMKPTLIYQSLLLPDDRIETKVFPGLDSPVPHALSSMSEHARAKVDLAIWQKVNQRVGLSRRSDKYEVMEGLDEYRARSAANSSKLTDVLALEFYSQLVRPHLNSLPTSLKKAVKDALG